MNLSWREAIGWLSGTLTAVWIMYAIPGDQGAIGIIFGLVFSLSGLIAGMLWQASDDPS